jgi:transcriptional regulator with XRE-family HTH domain
VSLNSNLRESEYKGNKSVDKIYLKFLAVLLMRRRRTMTMYDMDTARSRLRELITRREMLHKEIAAICKVTDSAVANWLRGSPIPMAQLDRLAEYFGVTPGYMRGEDVAFERVYGLRIQVARCEGLLRGLLYRQTHVDSVFRDELSQMYWSTLIKENRQLLDVLAKEWDSSIAPLLQTLEQEKDYDETYIRLVIQICHFLANRMRFRERIHFATAAAKKAKALADAADTGSVRQLNYRAAALILHVDGVSWGKIELGQTGHLEELLTTAEREAQAAHLPHFAALAQIFRARAILHDGVDAVQTLEEWYACRKHNAVKARSVLDAINDVDRTDYILSNRYDAVKAEILLAAQAYDEAINLHKTMLQHTKTDMELSVGMDCSLAYAQVEKAVALDGQQRVEALKSTRKLMREDDSRKLWSEQLLTDIARIRRLEIQGNRKKALAHATETWRLYVSEHGITQHNLITLLRLLIKRLESPA